MNVGIIGLGKMGSGVAKRVIDGGFGVFGYDPNEQTAHDAQQLGVHVAQSVAELAQKSTVIWLMVPPGQLIDTLLQEITPHLNKDAIIVDGGNSLFKDSMRRAAELEKKGIWYLDCGTSGGVAGKELGFCLMVGGNKQAYEKVLPVLQAVAMPAGVGYMGQSGTGHYVKMVHNGIEYGLLQAYAEGFEILHEGSFAGQLDLKEITRVWNHGSIIRSWIAQLAHNVFEQNPDFAQISGQINELGTGRWTLEEAQEHKIKVPVIEKSLEVRAWSRQTGGNFATKMVALLRNAFGGHVITKVNEK